MLSGVSNKHDQRGIRALVTQMHAADQRNALVFHLLMMQVARAWRPSACNRAQIGVRFSAQTYFNGGFAHCSLVGQAHAVGRHHAGQRMHEHRLHAQRIGHQAGVLAAGAAKAGQRVFGDVVAALHRDLLDGVGHIADGDIRKPSATCSGVAGCRWRQQSLGHVAKRWRTAAAARCLPSAPNSCGKCAAGFYPA
jgi:hypothetical protein